MAKVDKKRRPPSFLDDEEITIKPSTELIPDEYEREDNQNVLVELVCWPDDEEALALAEQLSDLGFVIHKTLPETSIIDEIWIQNFICGVKDKVEKKNYDGLMVIFAKLPCKFELVTNTWGRFTTKQCPSLKNKPKIFIFQCFYRSGLQPDSVMKSRIIDLKAAYDSPSEADILIVLDKDSSDASNDFLEYFYEHIRDYGHQEDIINLISLCMGSVSRPLVISTMTRKFFFTVNQYRGHHHNINKSHAEIKEDLKKIIEFVKTAPDHKPKDKENGMRSSFRRTIKTINNFINKNHNTDQKHAEDRTEANDKVKKQNEVKEVKKSEVNKEKAVAGSSKAKPPALKVPVETFAVPPSKSPTRRSSTPVTPTRKNALTRNRLTSETLSSKEDLKKKPWR